MFKKKENEKVAIKQKNPRTMKVGTHKKTVIALWLVLIGSVGFGVYKNFTAIDQHTTHEKEIIELRLNDTNGIENFVKNFVRSYYTWDNSKESIEKHTASMSQYMTKELQDLNVDTVRSDIPTATEKELAYYVQGNALAPINGDYLFSELVNPVFTQDGENVEVSLSVKFIDSQTKATQSSQYELTLLKESNWKIIK